MIRQQTSILVAVSISKTLMLIHVNTTGTDLNQSLSESEGKSEQENEISNSTSPVLGKSRSNFSFINIWGALELEHNDATAVLYESFLRNPSLSKKLGNGSNDAVFFKVKHSVLKDNITLDRLEDENVFEEIGENRPDSHIFVKAYYPSKGHEFKKMVAFWDGEELRVPKREYMSSFYEDVFDIEVKFNEKIRDHNKICHLSGKSQQIINVPKFITSGVILNKIDTKSVNVNRDKPPSQIGSFTAFEFIPNLSDLETSEDWHEYARLLNNLHKGPKITHYDVSPRNVKRNDNGDIFILDFNSSYDLEPLANKTFQLYRQHDPSRVRYFESMLHE